jgi:hypothetical protein
MVCPCPEFTGKERRKTTDVWVVPAGTGHKVRRHVGRIVDGRRFVRTSGNRSAEAGQVESVSPV